MDASKKIKLEVNSSLIRAVLHGNLERVKELINSYGLNYSQQWAGGYVLLRDAIENKHVAVAKLLLESGARVNSVSGNPANSPLHFAVINGYIKMVEVLLDKGARINAQNACGQTPLHVALMRTCMTSTEITLTYEPLDNKEIKVVELLLKRGANVDVEDSFCERPIHIAAEMGDLLVMEMLLKYGAQVNCVRTYRTCYPTREKCHAPLHLAVKSGNNEVVALLLSRGAHVDVKGTGGKTPLHIAAQEGFTCIAEQLLNHGASTHSTLFNWGGDSHRIEEGSAPLHLASGSGHEEVVKLLLNRGADVNASTKDNSTPLHFAIKNGYKKVISLLLEGEAKVDIQDKDGKTALHLASESGHEEVVKLLLNRGADVNTSTKDNSTPLHIAIRRGHEKVISLLLEGEAKVDIQDKDGKTALHLASESSHEEVVKLLLNRGADVNTSTKDNSTPLHFAIRRGHQKVISLLLEHGAKVDIQDKDDKTALRLAVEKGNSSIVQDVLKYFPDVNDEINRSCLETAVLGYIAYYKDIVEALLKYGFTVDSNDANNSQLFHAAVEKGYLKIVEDLLKCGADVDMLHTSYSKEGFTPLHAAAESKQKEVAELLLSHKADINAKCKNGKTPVFYAIENADWKTTKLLLTNGANVENSTKLLVTAVKKGYFEIVEILLQHGADVNANDEYGRTPLHYTASAPYYIDEHVDPSVRGEIAKLLLSKGANVHAQAKNGVTTLHAASYEGFAEVVEAVLGHGADVNAKLNGGVTALHIATLNGHQQVVKLLLDYGAEVDSKMTGELTRLHFLFVENRLGKMFLNYRGSNVDAPDEGHRTALHIASQNGHSKVVETLLEYGSDINITTDRDHTPLGLAIAQMNAFHIRNRNYFYVEYRDVVSPCEVTANTLKLHLIKMKTANLNVSEQNLRALAMMAVGGVFNYDESCFPYKCEEEIARMMSDKIDGTNVSFYDVLAKGTTSLEIYLNNKNVLQVLKGDDYKTKFPIYASMMKNNYKKGMERKQLLGQVSKMFHHLTHCPHLPLDCNEEIFGYLSNEDLKILMEAFEPLRISMERRELLDRARKVFHHLTHFPDLPRDCTAKIFSYLSNEDLKMLMKVCEPLSSINPDA